MNQTRGYYDLQVNGYGGIDFNQDDLTAEQLHTACQKLADDGVDAILATVITDTLDRMTRRLSNLARLRAQDMLAQRLIAGLHIEGPFINIADGYRGAHPADAIHPANVDEMSRLLDACDGLAKLVTLAPECDPGLATTRMLYKQGIAVAAGHCDASVDCLKAAIDAGLTLYTHLGNGCPMNMHRHDNIIQRVLSLHEHLYITFIADGVHVPFVALGNYLTVTGFERAVIVTDAIAPAGLGPGRYTLGRWELNIGDDMVARAPDGSHLIGAAVTMKRSAENLAEHLGLGGKQIRQLLVDNPRRAIGVESAAQSGVK